jgi:serralysin
VTISWFTANGTDPIGNWSGTGYEWGAEDLSALNLALASWEAVTAVEFVAADGNESDAWFWLLSDIDLQGDGGYSFYPYGWNEPLYTALNADDPSAGYFSNGGFGLYTFIHEVGHLLGLDHPHDDTPFPGVIYEDDLGNFNLNQQVFTVMSYNFGWASEYPVYSDYRYGLPATPMAFDIAAIQAIYGANTTYASGGNTYRLPTANASGTYWSCIWDTGGTDLVTNEGSSIACTIDLRAATLMGENGGGYISFASGVVGGFTIANGVVIENATGGRGNDVITGNAANNTLIGANGKDTLTGGLGNDSYVFNAVAESGITAAKSDVITDFVRSQDKINLGGIDAFAGTGTKDVFVWRGTAAFISTNQGEVRFQKFDATGTANDHTMIWIDNDADTGVEMAIRLTGLHDLAATDFIFTTVAAGPTEGNDTLVGTASNETINGLGGNDTISGLAGNDTLIGGLGNDTLDGGAGNDVLTGGDGTDTASYATATAGVTVNLAFTKSQKTVGSGNDTLSGIENLIGSAFNDVLTGSSTANRIDGGSGNDVVNGGGGTDVLDGGEGSDVYLVTLLADKTAAEITDTGTTGTDELRFAATTVGTLTLLAGDTGLERVVIGTGTGASAATTGKVALNVDATASANGLTITGNAGNNTLTGSGFADTLDGGAGNDVLIGGLGQDTLTGGIGNDIFKFSLITESGTTATKSDVITDFVKGQDVIDLSGLDAFLATKNVNDTFIWQGTAAFSNTKQGEVRYEKFDVTGTANDHTMIWIDNDKDTGVEMGIRLTGLHDLVASDFVL